MSDPPEKERKPSLTLTFHRTSDGPDLPEGRGLPCVVNINATHLFFGGGFTGAAELESNMAWLYEWATQTWTRIADLLYAGNGFFCHPIGGGQLMVLGGYNSDTNLIEVMSELFP